MLTSVYSNIYYDDKSYKNYFEFYTTPIRIILDYYIFLQLSSKNFNLL